MQRALRGEAASGVLLLSAAALALLWANSPWSQSYATLWQMPLRIHAGKLHFERGLDWFVNDALMVIFFFVVGLEIRHELAHGELSEWRRAALPVAAAVGGMIAPAALYLCMASAPATRMGWGVPMATDIAFAVGILTLLGKRVPRALRVLLLALAVIDDLGAIIVIALFYSAPLKLAGGYVVAAGLGAIFLLRSFAVRSKLVYVLPGVCVWAGVYHAGIHPTIAGVALGLITPLQAAPGESSSPAQSLRQSLQPWVSFAIMPIFALANAGVSLRGLSFDPSSVRVIAAVVLGLVLGKPLGVLAAIAIVLKLGVARAPDSLSARQISVVGIVAGVGFTMALFVAQLAFTDAELLSAAKLGVLIGSAFAALLTILLGRMLLRPT
jgi:Na+:H+ antiporter, NhaA family